MPFARYAAGSSSYARVNGPRSGPPYTYNNNIIGGGLVRATGTGRVLFKTMRTGGGGSVYTGAKGIAGRRRRHGAYAPRRPRRIPIGLDRHRPLPRMPAARPRPNTRDPGALLRAARASRTRVCPRRWKRTQAQTD